MKYTHGVRRESAMVFVLKALVPYTEANLMLAFKPGQFFAELEKISRYKKRALEEAFYRAEKQDLINKRTRQKRNIFMLTEQGRKVVRPFIAQELKNNAKLMVIFDIPEEMKTARNTLRRVLKNWNFNVVQKSVWISSYDHRQSVSELVSELEIEPYVQLFECAPAKF